MREVCPISFEQINERVAQMNAALVVFSLLVFMFTSFKWIILIICIDFFIRGFFNPSYSLYSAASKNILKILKIKPLMINAGPKIFAAKVGFIFCCIIALCYMLNFYITALVFTMKILSEHWSMIADKCEKTSIYEKKIDDVFCRHFYARG